MKLLEDRRGIALPLALFALVIIGALVGSTFFAGLVEQQSARSTLFAAQAREAAESGLSDAIAALDADSLTRLVIGDAPLALDSITLHGGAVARRQVSRLTSRVFLIRSQGVRRTTGGILLGERSLGALVELAAPAAPTDSGSVPARELRVVERGWVQLY